MEDTLADMDPVKSRQKWKSLLKKSSALQKLGFGGSRENSIRMEAQIPEQDEEELRQAFQITHSHFVQCLKYSQASKIVFLLDLVFIKNGIAKLEALYLRVFFCVRCAPLKQFNLQSFFVSKSLTLVQIGKIYIKLNQPSTSYWQIWLTAIEDCKFQICYRQAT